jgi:hypothetical protein
MRASRESTPHADLHPRGSGVADLVAHELEHSSQPQQAGDQQQRIEQRLERLPANARGAGSLRGLMRLWPRARFLLLAEPASPSTRGSESDCNVDCNVDTRGAGRVVAPLLTGFFGFVSSGGG